MTDRTHTVNPDDDPGPTRSDQLAGYLARLEQIAATLARRQTTLTDAQCVRQLQELVADMKRGRR